ncbi:MAG: hypothetical protein ACTSV7_14935 [Candidatus Baldrarchaeia archaeon]
MPRQKRLVEPVIYTKEEEFEETPAEEIVEEIPQAEDLLNDIAIKGREITEDMLPELYTIVSSEVLKRGRYARIFRSSVRRSFAFMGFEMEEWTLAQLERNPVRFNAEQTSHLDPIKTAFVELATSFSACKQYYERLILVLHKLIEFQKGKIEELEERLKKKEELF